MGVFIGEIGVYGESKVGERSWRIERVMMGDSWMIIGMVEWNMRGLWGGLNE